jgi:hypothetical protein
MIGNATARRATSVGDRSDPEVEGKLRRAKVSVSAPPARDRSDFLDRMGETSSLDLARHTQNQGRSVRHIGGRMNGQTRPAHRACMARFLEVLIENPEG